MEKKFDVVKLAVSVIIFGIIGGVTALISGIQKKQQEKKFGWMSAWKVDPDDLPAGSNIYLDVDKQKLLDYDTGEILEDFSQYEDPKKAMTEFMNLMWSFK